MITDPDKFAPVVHRSRRRPDFGSSGSLPPSGPHAPNDSERRRTGGRGDQSRHPGQRTRRGARVRRLCVGDECEPWVLEPAVYSERAEEGPGSAISSAGNSACSLLSRLTAGVSPDNISDVVRAGCDWIVAGSSIFESADPAATVTLMQQLARDAAARPCVMLRVLIQDSNYEV